MTAGPSDGRQFCCRGHGEAKNQIQEGAPLGRDSPFLELYQDTLFVAYDCVKASFCECFIAHRFIEIVNFIAKKSRFQEYFQRAPQ